MADLSNVISALTQGNEDASAVVTAGSISTDTPSNFSIDEVTDGNSWEYVWQISGNATQPSLTFPLFADNHSEPTTNHLICGVWLRFTDLSPATEYRFFASLNAPTSEIQNDGQVSTSLVLETDGDVRVQDLSEATIWKLYGRCFWFFIF